MDFVFSSIQMLTKIKKYSEENPDNIILATGDSVQLESIDILSDQIDYDIYIANIVWIQYLTIQSN